MAGVSIYGVIVSLNNSCETRGNQCFRQLLRVDSILFQVSCLASLFLLYVALWKIFHCVHIQKRELNRKMLILQVLTFTVLNVVRIWQTITEWSLTYDNFNVNEIEFGIFVAL